MDTARVEIRDGMHIAWDAPIAMDDGVVLRADVFRPCKDGVFPVLLSYGPYAKGLEFKQGYRSNWERLVQAAPEVLQGSSNKYQNWELVDPERWVPDGYACIRVDSRGAGRSPGIVDCWSPRETDDLYQCIEWAGTRDWCNGRVGLNGISYYAMNQWQVAALNPPHLAAICVWEGASDYYRELCRHGGILCDFLGNWYERQVASVQHGLGERGPRSAVTGDTIAGPETLPDDVLDSRRADLRGEARTRSLLDRYYQDRMPRFEQIEVPLLSAANWGGQGLHTRGNFEGFVHAGSRHKWLEVHGHTHFTHFYSHYGESLQRRFFGHFLKGEDTGWERQPRVALNIRSPGEQFQWRAENEWPLDRTQWTRYYLRCDDGSLGTEPSRARATLSYETTGAGLPFVTSALARPLEITGPAAAHLWVSSDTTDADVFVVLSVYDPAGQEVTFIGSNDPRVPVGLGWLRASHRKRDPTKSLPYRPWHTHDELWRLTPNVAVELCVEIWPTSILVPAGYRIGVTIQGKDYECDGSDAGIAHAAYPMKGVGPFTHTDPVDRPSEIFHGRNSLHFSPDRPAYVLLPIVPADDERPREQAQ